MISSSREDRQVARSQGETLAALFARWSLVRAAAAQAAERLAQQANLAQQDRRLLERAREVAVALGVNVDGEALARVATVPGADAPWNEEESALRALLAERLEHMRKQLHISLRLRVHSVARNRKLLQYERLSCDEACVMLYSLQGRLPFAHDFLDDERLDAAGLGPSLSYLMGQDYEGQTCLAELDGVAPVAPGGGVSSARLQLPWRAAIPGAEVVYRLRSRGVVGSIELYAEGVFRELLSEDEAAVFLGHAFALQAKGVWNIVLQTASG